MTDYKMDYLTDDELEKLIADVETHGMLTAPSYLRDEVLKKTEVPLYKKKLQFYAYSFKVCAAAAAAIVLMFSIPMDRELPEVREETSITEELSRRAGSLCESLNDFSDMLIRVERVEE